MICSCKESCRKRGVVLVRGDHLFWDPAALLISISFGRMQRHNVTAFKSGERKATVMVLGSEYLSLNPRFPFRY